MHLLLPTIFTLSPALGWWIAAPWLTLVLAAIAIPAAEWFWGGYAPTATSYRWGVWLPRIFMLSVLIVTVILAINAAHYEWDALVWLAL